jgi:hypothetical protein
MASCQTVVDMPAARAVPAAVDPHDPTRACRDVIILRVLLEGV